MSALCCRLLAGADAREWASLPANAARWDRLHERCEWRQPFLSRAFFDIWLAHYGEIWEPVLVLGEDGDGELRSLMPLARRAGLVTGAGGHHAEYQGWLGDARDAGAFLRAALDAIDERFPGHRVHLRYLHESLPAEAVREAVAGDARAELRTHACPLVKLDRTALQASLQKKHTRNHLNRLRREGPLVFEQRPASSLSEAMLDRIFLLYDLRQGGANDSRPFLDDPRKRGFHLDWLRRAPDHIDVTLMLLGEDVIGAYLGVRSPSASHMAILAYSPFQARNSVGRILLYSTAAAFADGTREFLDLTPGGDAWKERFATDHSSVLELIVHGSAFEARRKLLEDRALGVLRSALARVGVTPAQLRSLPGRWRRRRDEQQLLYRIGLPRDREAVPGTEVRVNCLEDLVRFRPRVGDRGGEGASAFLWNALQRLEAGARACTIRSGERLEYSAWLHPAQEKAPLPELGEAFARFGPGAVVFGFSSAEGRAQEVHCEATLARLFADLAAGERMLYAIVSERDAVTRAVLERAGFESLGRAPQGQATRPAAAAER